jgi:asparagine synthase (glutamine-hydrolysing)
VAGFQDRHLRSVQAHGRQEIVTVIGDCLATDREVRACLALAGAARWRAFGMLPGSFWTVVHGPAETVVLGDLMGRRCVFVASSEGRLVWATAATPLAALVGSEVRLERLVLELAVSGVPRSGGETVYAGVARVPPGSLLRITAQSHRIERWYTAGESIGFAQAQERFREWLPDGVRRTAPGGQRTADLSAGIDSGTVAVLAAQDRDLIAYTYVEDPLDDDLAVVSRIAAGAPRMSHRVVQIDERMLHYRGLEDPASLPCTDLPATDVALTGPNRAILELAAEAGSTDHLKGDNGDLVLSARPTRLVSLLRAGESRAAFRAALTEARTERASATQLSVAALRMASGSYRSSLRRAARIVRARKVDPRVEPDYWQLMLNWAWPTCVAGCLTEAAAEWVAQQLDELADRTPEHPEPERALDWWEARRSAGGSAATRQLADGLGISLRTPYEDARILDLCLSLGGHEREPEGTFKPLATSGLADVLAPELARRGAKDRLLVTHASRRGIRRHRREIRGLVASDSSALVTAGVLDRRPVSTRLEALVDGSDTNASSLKDLVAVEVWAATRDLRRTTWWEEDPR